MNTLDRFIPELHRVISANWNLPAFSDYKGPENRPFITYAQVAEQITRLHLLYRAARIQVGDKIALVGKNQSNWGIAFFSILTYGAVAVPIMNDFKPESIAHVIDHADVKLIIAGEQIWKNRSEASFPKVHTVLNLDQFTLIEADPFTHSSWLGIDQTMDEIYPDGFSPADLQFKQPQQDDLSIINYTSGTTGFSKGVMLPFRSLWTNLEFTLRTIHSPKVGDKIVSMLPLGHMFGLTYELLFCFFKGCHIHVLTKMPTPQVIFEAFSEVKPTWVVTVPLVIEKIYKKRILPSLQKPAVKILLKIPFIKTAILKKVNQKLMDAFGGKLIQMVISGAPLNPDVEKLLMKIKFPITIGYGMTECAPLVSFTQYYEHRYLSCGKAIDLTEIKIDSPDQHKIVGEVLVKGPQVMQGYYKNPSETDKVLKNGWYYTGDLGVIDKDGHLFIKGRSKNVLIGASGQNIYPEEIENILNNMEDVAESIVVSRKGKLVALVFPDPDIIAEQDLTATQVVELMEQNRQLTNEKLPAYSRLAEIVIQENEFEKTSKRSIKRFLYS